MDPLDIAAAILLLASGALLGIGGFLLGPTIGFIMLGVWALGSALLLGLRPAGEALPLIEEERR